MSFSFAQKEKQPLQTNIFGDSVLLSKTKYRLVGPFRGGRSGAVAGDYKDKNTFYFGATGGGVWKTQDGGSNWKNISDKFFGGSIGSVAVAPSNSSVVYVGEGEIPYAEMLVKAMACGAVMMAGRTGNILGLIIQGISCVLLFIQIILILYGWLRLGHLFGPSDDRGVYKTIDGGKTWKKVLFSDDQSGAAEFVMEPGNPSVLYAATWTVKRTPYSLESGGKGSALMEKYRWRRNLEKA